MRRFYASPESFQSKNVSLDFDESRHLREVLRLQKGDEVRVFDGEGKEFSCAVQETGTKKTSAVLSILHQTNPFSPESVLDLTVAVALLKGEKLETVVQKATELGVTKIVPLMTKRCDVKLKNAADFDKRRERLRKIAVEAAKQCGRAKIMEVSPLTEFQSFIESAKAAKILFAEKNGESFAAIRVEQKITVVIGAEGGWEDSEIEAAQRNNFQIITFGGRILRAETAAITIPAILQHRFGDLN